MKSKQEAALDMIRELLNNSNKTKKAPDDLKEDLVKELVKVYLENLGWKADIAWGKQHGIDIDATKGAERWIIEAKGTGKNQPSRDKSFNDLLGAILQRMEYPKAKYSIALPDIEHFKDLWTRRVPRLAKERTGLTALFVNSAGEVREEK